MSDGEAHMDPDKAYVEVGHNYRYFAKWRTLAWVANLAAMYAILTLTVTAFKDTPEVAWCVPLVGTPFGICLLFADRRTRELTLYAIEAGAKLERGTEGFFQTQKTRDEGKKGIPRILSWLFSHSFAAFCFFVGSSAMLAFLAWYLKPTAK